MARPINIRVVTEMPEVTYYKPQGISLKEMEEIVLSVDEFEAFKLKDYLKKKENEACDVMRISQSTFNRVYNRAKEKIIKSLVEGFAIRIEGGNIKMPNRDGTGPQGRGARTGRGLGSCQVSTEETAKNEQVNVQRGQGLGAGRGLGRNQGTGRGRRQ